MTSLAALARAADVAYVTDLSIYTLLVCESTHLVVGMMLTSTGSMRSYSRFGTSWCGDLVDLVW